MKTFQKFFGLSGDSVKPHCIICPANDAGLFLCPSQTAQPRGLFFRAVNTGFATVISTKNNFMIGDCILSLKDTACRNIYLFGSCAGHGGLEIGGGALVQKSFSLESFTEMSRFEGKPDVCYPDDSLVNAFLPLLQGKPVVLANCVTVGSLLLEDQYVPWLLKHKVSCADMESSIVFAASNYIKRKALALLYVTDTVGQKPFYEEATVAEREKINAARHLLARLLCEFIKDV